jgi:glycogen phosphorylase
LPLFQSVLPRHLEIIYAINARFMDDMRLRYPFDQDRIARLSLIDESGPRYVRMANLACVGSHAINGVAALHTRIAGRNRVLRDFHAVWPEKFQNKTNGVTPRRFIMLSNPGLSACSTETLGAGWGKDLDTPARTRTLADDAAFQQRWRAVKLERKRNLARFVQARLGIELDPASLFDVQVKRIHEYKRQHLNLLHIITLYNRIKRNPGI